MSLFQHGPEVVISMCTFGIKVLDIAEDRAEKVDSEDQASTTTGE